MQIIDTHIHMADFLKKPKTNGIAIIPSAKQSDWQKIIDICAENKSFIPAFGIHPWHAALATKNWDKELDILLQKFPNALIGECGLDRLKNKEYSPQNEIFKTQINLATKYNRALIIHAIRSNEWLEEYWQYLKKIKYVFHSFNGKVELLNKIIKNNGYISFSSSILNNKDKETILNSAPLDKIMIETDAPHQEGHIKNTAKEISKILNIEYNDFLNIVYYNTINFLSSEAAIS